MNLTIKEIRCFHSVAEAGSFTQASEMLGTHANTISQQVRNLERKVGQELLVRSTRALSLTPAGEEFLRESRELLNKLTEMNSEISYLGNEPTGEVRIDASSTMVRSLILPNLPEFIKENPGIVLKIRHTGQIVGVHDSGFDVMLRFGDLADTELLGRTLFLSELWLVAAPEYLRRNRKPRVPSDLSRHNCIIFIDARTKKNLGSWRLSNGNGVEEVPVSGNVICDDASGSLQAALDGAGILISVKFQVAELVKSGKLIRVLPEWHGGPLPLNLLYHRSSHMPLRVRKVITFLSRLQF